MVEQKLTMSKLDKKIKRLDTSKGRYYYFWEDPSRFFLSATSFAKVMLPRKQPDYLEDWKINVGVALGDKKLMEDYVDATATYGTVLDILVDKLFMGETITPTVINDVMFNEMISDKMYVMNDLVQVWQEKLAYHLLAIKKWADDYKFEPVLVQAMIVIDDCLGGTIDLAGYITIQEEGDFGEVYKSGPRKGEPKLTKQDKRVFGLFDLKSGKYFYEAHELQLVIYKRGLEQLYPELPKVEFIGNIAPKDWITGPSYNFKDQTNTKVATQYPHFLEVAKIRGLFDINPTFLDFKEISMTTPIEFNFKTLKDIADDERRTNPDSNK